MSKLVKCPKCSTMNEKENTEKYKGRYYCPDCLAKKKAENNINTDGWDALYEYIVDLYGHKPTGMMFKQLGEYRKDPYNYTNTGMLLTLKYFHETLNNAVLEGTGLGIIPYYYEKAKQSFIKTRQININNSEVEYNDKKTLVKITPSKGKKLGGEKIDFSDLEEDDE